MKPWEETWEATDCADVCTPGRTFALDDGERGARHEDHERASLAAAAPDLVRALLAVEWVESEEVFAVFCPTCESWIPSDKPRAHRDGCELVAALRKAGVRE